VHTEGSNDTLQVDFCTLPRNATWGIEINVKRCQR